MNDSALRYSHRTRRVRRCGALAVLYASLLGSGPAAANEFFVIDDGAPDVIGELGLTTTVYEDTVSDLARAYSQGFNEMRLANPDVDPWLPGAGTEVVIPSLYVLPAAARRGIVINVPEMRLYYFPPGRVDGQAIVHTYPISIGRQEWRTPKGQMNRLQGQGSACTAGVDPQGACRGQRHPAAGGASRTEQPARPACLRLSLTATSSMGPTSRTASACVTHGCIRMYPKDVERIFGLVNVGTAVHVVNQPFKVGLAHGRIFLEVHPPLDEDVETFANQYSEVVKLVVARVKGLDAELAWGALQQTLERRSGLPEVIGSYRERPTMAAAEPAASAH